MMKNTVVPLLVERMGGMKVMKIRVLRTCAVGESNIDRAIGDLMTEKNPTVGLAAHAGQTDVRITVKTDTEAEAEALIAPMEAKLRERLGVAIYGSGKEGVAEVVGRLLAEKGLKLGVVDTLTGGQLTRELIDSGFGQLIDTDLRPTNLADALAIIPNTSGNSRESDGMTVTAALAQAIAPTAGVGLAIAGPFADSSTHIALHGPDNIRLNEIGRNFRDTDYIRRWLVIQGLDWIRRAVLGQLSSPVDWN
jgi:nicotinamide-nucleotide amidase